MSGWLSQLGLRHICPTVRGSSREKIGGRLLPMRVWLWPERTVLPISRLNGRTAGWGALGEGLFSVDPVIVIEKGSPTLTVDVGDI